MSEGRVGQYFSTEASRSDEGCSSYSGTGRHPGRDTVILLLSYGTPERIDDIPAYILDIRGGRETPPALIEEIRDRYRQIGGQSPLTDINRSIAAKLAHATGIPVHVGMRHWHPYISEVVARIARAGARRIVGLCMAPHYSRLSIGAYRQKLDEAVRETGVNLSIDFIESWHTQPTFINALADNITSTLRRFDERVRHDVRIVMTAHSLPEFILDQGDPYQKQLHETAELLADRLGIDSSRWDFCFQSAGRTETPWLGPPIEEFIPTLAARGVQNILIAPIGFIADHVEILYDLDIGVQQIARACGVRAERTPMLNDSPALIATLRSLVEFALTPA